MELFVKEDNIEGFNYVCDGLYLNKDDSQLIDFLVSFDIEKNIKNAVESSNVFIRMFAASLKELETDDISLLCKDESESVRITIASRDDLNTHQLNTLANDVYFEVRKKIAQKTHLPSNIKLLLARDSSIIVNNAIFKNRYFMPNELCSLAKSEIYNALNNIYLTEDHLRAVISSDDIGACDKIAERYYLPENIINQLSRLDIKKMLKGSKTDALFHDRSWSKERRHNDSQKYNEMVSSYIRGFSRAYYATCRNLYFNNKLEDIIGKYEFFDEYIAGEDNLSDEVLYALCKSNNVTVKKKLSERKILPIWAIKQLINSGDEDYIQYYICGREDLSNEIIEELARSECKGIRQSIIQNHYSQLSQKTLLTLSRDNSIEILECLYRHPLSKTVAESIYSRKDLPMSFWEGESNIPISLIPSLLDDKSLSESLKCNIASMENAPLYILTQLSIDTNIDVRAVISRNKSISEDIINTLSNDKEALIRVSLALHATLTNNTLLKLAKDDNESVRLAVAVIENLPENIAIILIKDSSEFVRLSVTMRCKLPDNIISELFEEDSAAILISLLSRYEQSDNFTNKIYSSPIIKRIIDTDVAFEFPNVNHTNICEIHLAELLDFLTLCPYTPMDIIESLYRGETDDSKRGGRGVSSSLDWEIVRRKDLSDSFLQRINKCSYYKRLADFKNISSVEIDGLIESNSKDLYRVINNNVLTVNQLLKLIKLGYSSSLQKRDPFEEREQYYTWNIILEQYRQRVFQYIFRELDYEEKNTFMDGEPEEEIKGSETLSLHGPYGIHKIKKHTFNPVVHWDDEFIELLQHGNTLLPRELEDYIPRSNPDIDVKEERKKSDYFDRFLVYLTYKSFDILKSNDLYQYVHDYKKNISQHKSNELQLIIQLTFCHDKTGSDIDFCKIFSKLDSWQIRCLIHNPPFNRIKFLLAKYAPLNNDIYKILIEDIDPQVRKEAEIKFNEYLDKSTLLNLINSANNSAYDKIKESIIYWINKCDDIDLYVLTLAAQCNGFERIILDELKVKFKLANTKDFPHITLRGLPQSLMESSIYETVKKLATSFSTDIKVQLFTSKKSIYNEILPILSDTEINWLVLHPNEELHEYLSAHYNLNQSNLNFLLNSSSLLTKANIIINNKFDDAILMEYSDDKDTEIRKAVAKRTVLNEYLTEKLAYDSNDTIRAEIAKRPELSQHLVMKLASDSSDSVRSIVVSRINIDNTVLKILIKDSNKIIKDKALKQLKSFSSLEVTDLIEILKDASIHKDIKDKALEYIKNTDNITECDLRSLIEMNKVEIKSYIATRKNLPIKIVRNLMGINNHTLKLALIENIDIGFQHIKYLVNDMDHSIRAAIAERPDLPTNLVSIFVKDRSHHVRQVISKSNDLSNIEKSILSYDEDHMVRLNIASQISLSDILISSLVFDSNDEVKETIRQRSDLESEHYQLFNTYTDYPDKSLINDNFLGNSIRVASILHHPDIDVRIKATHTRFDNVAALIVHDRIESVRESLAKNSFLDNDTIKLLLNDASKLVSSSLAFNNNIFSSQLDILIKSKNQSILTTLFSREDLTPNQQSELIPFQSDKSLIDYFTIKLGDNCK